MSFARRNLCVTAFALLSCGGLWGQRSVVASSFPGADLGAQLNAADAALGSAPGILVVNAGGTVSTPVHLGAGHGLQLQKPTVWAANATIGGGNAIACTGENALLTVQLPPNESLFQGDIVQHISMDGCWMKATNPGRVLYFALDVRQADHISVTHCHAVDMGLLYAHSGARSQAENSETLSSHDIEFSNNVIDSPTRFSGQTKGTGVLLECVTGARVTHNVFHGMTHGVQYWGGDGNKNIRDKFSPRWARDILIADNQCSDVGGSCYWGSMGQNIQFLRNRAQNCGDACLDVEGDVNDLADGNTVIDGNLGILMRNYHLEYRNNTVITTHGAEVFVHISNNVPNGNDNLDIYIHDNVFKCEDPHTLCNIEYQDVQNFVFEHNMVTNGIMHPYAHQQSGTVVANNTFVFDHANAAQFAAIDASWQVNGATARVENNIIRSDAPQPPDSECIYLQWADTGAPSEQYVVGNTCGGSHPFPIDLVMVSSGSRSSGVTFHVSGNHFANNRIVETDNTHTAQFDIHR